MDVFALWNLIPVAGLLLVAWYVMHTSGRSKPGNGFGRGATPGRSPGLDGPAPAEN